MNDDVIGRMRILAQEAGETNDAQDTGDDFDPIRFLLAAARRFLTGEMRPASGMVLLTISEEEGQLTAISMFSSGPATASLSQLTGILELAKMDLHATNSVRGSAEELEPLIPETQA